MVDMPVPLTSITKSRGNWLWSQRSVEQSVDPSSVQDSMLRGTGYQSEKATLCRVAAGASGAPPVTAPMS